MRWISCVLPPILPRVASLAVLSGEEKGIIEYSHVIHPPGRLCSLIQRGVISSTDAAQTTLVSPNSTSTEPRGYFTKSLVILTGLSASGALPSLRIIVPLFTLYAFNLGP